MTGEGLEIDLSVEEYGGKAGLLKSKAAISAALVVLACELTGCGGSSSGTTDASSAGGGTDSTAVPTGSSAPAPGFSPKAKLAAFGEEANAAEREQASEILEENLKARAAGDYNTQCETLSPVAVNGIENNSRSALGKRNCAEALQAEAANAPPGLLENTMTEPIAAFRIRVPIGYALYHGKAGKDYSMKMELNRGTWEVAELLTEELPN